MTKKEAIALEALCEKYLKEALDTDVMVSMNLLGRLKVEFDGYYIVMNRALDAVSYINFTGYWDELHIHISNILECVKEHEDDFVRLIWSYNNRNKLTEE